MGNMKQFTVLFALSNFMLVHCLICNSGYNIRSAFLNDDEINGDQINSIECPTNASQKCVRGEALIDFIAPAEIVVGACVNSERCEEDCILLTKEFSNDVFGIDDQIFNVTSCKSRCCEGDNCNANTIQELDESQNPSSIPSLRTTTSPTLEGASSCSSGVFNINTGEGNMSPSPCSSAHRFCLRQEVSALTSSGQSVSFHVGYCANATTCAKPCKDLASSAMEGERLEIQTCRKACCDFEDCNTLPVHLLAPLSSRLIPNQPRKPIITVQTTSPEASTGETISNLQTTTPLNLAEPTMPQTDSSDETTNYQAGTIGVSSILPPTINIPSETKITTRPNFIKTTSPILSSSFQTMVSVTDQTPSLGQNDSSNCLVGYEISQLSISSWNYIECNSTQSHLQIEFVVAIEDKRNFNVRVGTCKRSTICMTPCMDLAKYSLEDNELYKLANFNSSMSSISSCQMTCGHSKNCNKDNQPKPTDVTKGVVPSQTETTPLVEGGGGGASVSKANNLLIFMFSFAVTKLFFVN